MSILIVLGSTAQYASAGTDVLFFAMGLEDVDAATYASFPSTPTFRAFLPPNVDLSDNFPVPGYQGQQGSCASWATGYALRSYYSNRDKSTSNLTDGSAFSPAFIFNQLNSNGACRGTSIPAALDLLKKLGAVTLSEFPYSANDCNTQPDERLKVMAKTNRIGGWKRLNITRIDDAKGQLASGSPVVFGMHVSESFKKLQGQDVYDDTDSDRIGSHAMVMVGYNEERQAFKIINSWSTRWGDSGYGWISYRAAKILIHGEYVIDFSNDPDPIVVQPSFAITPPPLPLPSPFSSPVSLDFKGIGAYVQTITQATQCAHIENNVSADGIVTLNGFIGSTEQLTALEQRVRSLPGVDGVVNLVENRPWPQCEVLTNFAEPISKSRGLHVTLQGQSGESFRDGDLLTVVVTTPEFSSYLYVGYLQITGEVVPMYWSKAVGSTPIPAKSKYVFGGSEMPFRIGPPFGDEVVMVVASATPLFSEGEIVGMNDRDYLSSFRRAFTLMAKKESDEGNVSAAAVMIRTMP